MSNFIQKNVWLETSTTTPVPVEIPALGGHALVRAMSTVEQTQLPKVSEHKHEEKESLQARVRDIYRRSIVNEDGTPMFTADEIATLEAKHGTSVFSPVWRKIAEVNGWVDAPEDAAKN